jgi:predicted MFS family arabinose efflux permease
MTLYGLWVLRELGFSPVTLGVLVGVGGIGSFFGALLVGKASRRLGLGQAMIWGRTLSGLLGLLVPLAGGPMPLAFTLLFLHQVLGDGFWVVYDINAMSLRQAITPDRILGRVNATIHLLSEGLRPIGALVAGFLALVVGVQAAFFVGAGGQFLAVVWLIFSPIPRIRDQPVRALGE